MKKYAALLSRMILVGLPFCTLNPVTLGQQQPSDDTTKALAKEYQELREQRRNQEPGRFIPELDAYDGRMHHVMHELGERLGNHSVPEKKLVSLLGKPDEKFSAGQYHFGFGKNVPKGETHYAYWWRGGHDYLYFVVREGVVYEAKWWFALE